MISFSSFRSFIQPATQWCPNPNPRWSLLRRRRPRTGQSTGRREQRASHATQTKLHPQARNRGQQRTSSLKWTLTNCCSCQPWVSPLFVPLLAPPQFCHSSEIVIDGTVAALKDTDSSTTSQYNSSVIPPRHVISHFLWIQKYCVMLILNGPHYYVRVVSVGMETAFSVLLWRPMCWRLFLFRISWAHLSKECHIWKIVSSAEEN